MTDPFSIAILTGSPSSQSRTAALARSVEQRLSRGAFRVRTIQVRELPPAALLHAQTDDPAIASALDVVAKADGVVVASPVYKAAYTGVLKAFLDLLPQRGLSGKVVLPLLTGGSLAHVLALDYGLRPVLQSLEPQLAVTGLFVLDKWITVNAEGLAEVEADVAPRLEAVVNAFVEGLRGQ